MENIKAIFKLPELRQKLLYVVIMLFLYRLGSYIPISGLDNELLRSELFGNNSILGFINLFSGGGLERFSIFALGILPFINASIIMQLMTFISPKLKDLSQEGEAGRKQVAQYTRYLAVVLSIVQGLFFTFSFKPFVSPEIPFYFFVLYATLSLVAGAALVMWMGELITENGIGNGASLLIFVGIIAQIPMYISNTVMLVKAGTNIVNVLILILLLLFMIIAIVFVQEAERRIPVQYAKKVVGRKVTGGQTSYIPLRLIQGGVLPIIFASALLQFPLIIGEYIPIESVRTFFAVYYQYDGLAYNLFFCGLIFFFTYFYTAISFNPEELSNAIKRQGGFIMGVRPGQSTVTYLDRIISRLTLIGATFLAFVALVPILGANFTNVTSLMGLGGTAILIIVGVAMDLVKQIEVYIISKRYEGLI
ncbi:preprotein translocase subunit SecY [Candidatus Marinamargulisbacteria bacterium SCGC AG-410-N11]|nr:preprotein translocase subunit SecY [Candidatus Marinamargulisbacteria bacterium SCGC AG-410-N11]